MLTSILLVSYSRPKMLNDTIQGYFDTCGTHNIEVICVVDDPESYKVAFEWHYRTWNHDTFTVSAFENKVRVGALKAWNQALKLSHGHMLFPSGDDQKPHAGWLDTALKCHELQLNGYGCVGLNDLMHGVHVNNEPAVMTTLLFDRQFCKDVFGGVVAYECYKYLWVDMEMNERARKAGKLVWCKESVVEHMHSANLKRPMDAIDREKVGDALYLHDQGMFTARKIAGFPNDFEPVV